MRLRTLSPRRSSLSIGIVSIKSSFFATMCQTLKTVRCIIWNEILKHGSLVSPQESLISKAKDTQSSNAIDGFSFDLSCWLLVAPALLLSGFLLAWICPVLYYLFSVPFSVFVVIADHVWVLFLVFSICGSFYWCCRDVVSDFKLNKRKTFVYKM